MVLKYRMLIGVIIFLIKSSTSIAQKGIFFNIDSVAIQVVSKNYADNYQSVSQFIQTQKNKNNTKLYEIEYIEDQFSELKVLSDSVQFRFQNNCMIYCGMSLEDIDAALEGSKMYLFENPRRVYLEVKYLYKNKFIVPDGEYFVLYIKDDLVDYISYSRPIDSEDY